MKRTLAALFAAFAFTACTSVETATVSSNEIIGNGDAVAVIQADAIGSSLIFYLVDIVQADLDTVVNKLMVSEAKAMGANRVELKGFMTTPRHGIFRLTGAIIGFPYAHAEGVAVR
ncbi:MAG TPA: hypothetical protein DFS52_23685 [Myxococcales bacterium]|nr:hypothetical protein [Myxococcales bacterium]